MHELLHGVDLAEHRGVFELFLHEACRKNWEPAVRYLLGSGVDVNCTDGKNRTPLIIVAKNKNVDVVQCLVTHDQCDLNFDGLSAIRNALSPYDDSDIDSWDDYYIDPRDDCHIDPRDDCHIDPRDDCHIDPRDDCLIDPRDDCHIDPRDDCHLNVDGGSAIRNVLGPYDDSDIDSWDDYHTDPRDDYHIDPRDEDIQIYKCLVQAGADLNFPDQRGLTLLMNRPTGNYYNEKGLDLLVQYGADVNAVSSDGFSALSAAVGEFTMNIQNTSDLSDLGLTYEKFAPGLSYLKYLLAQNIDIGVSRYQYGDETLTPLQHAFNGCRRIACHVLLDADCSLYGIREFMSSRDWDERKHGHMVNVRARILEMCDQPYSLKVQARLAALRAIGQGNLRENLHRIHRSGLLPTALVNYLGKSIKFNVDGQEQDETGCSSFLLSLDAASLTD